MRNWYSSCYLALSSCCWFSFFSQKKKLWGIDSCCFVICNTYTHLHARTLEIKVAFMYAGWMKSFVFSLLNFCVYVCIWGMCAHGVQKLTSSVFLNFSLIYHYFWDIISFWTRNSTFWIGWLTSKPWGLYWFHPPDPVPSSGIAGSGCWPPILCACWWSRLKSSCLCSRHLTSGVISPALKWRCFFFFHVGCLSCLWCSF